MYHVTVCVVPAVHTVDASGDVTGGDATSFFESLTKSRSSTETGRIGVGEARATRATLERTNMWDNQLDMAERTILKR